MNGARGCRPPQFPIRISNSQVFVIPGWSEGPDPESRDSGLDASHRPGMTRSQLDTPLSFPRRERARAVEPTTLEKKRAQGMPGTFARTHSLACNIEKAHEHRRHRYSHDPAIPCAMVLTAYCALSPAIGLSCHRHRADRSAQFGIGVEMPGPHGFTVRFSRRSSSSGEASIASRAQRP